MENPLVSKATLLFEASHFLHRFQISYSFRREYWRRINRKDPRDQFEDPRDQFKDSRDLFKDPRDQFKDPRDQFKDSRDQFEDSRDQFCDASTCVRSYNFYNLYKITYLQNI